MLQETTSLEYAIQNFHNTVSPDLKHLATALDDAGISHYSSGCGVKKITYDIFPASYYVLALVDLVRLDRSHKVKSDTGLKDYSTQSEYNPAHQFMLYLERWGAFAEEVMQKEGDSARGIAAARAKLLIQILQKKLSNRTVAKPSRLGAKLAAASKDMNFHDVMRGIGHTLESQKQQARDRNLTSTRERMHQNYQKALQAANQAISPESFLAA